MPVLRHLRAPTTGEFDQLHSTETLRQLVQAPLLVVAQRVEPGGGDLVEQLVELDLGGGGVGGGARRDRCRPGPLHHGAALVGGPAVRAATPGPRSPWRLSRGGAEVWGGS